ncbi:MAG: carbohydrate ABC transporter permease, partial [Candidatus Scatosoma sp.]
EKVAGDNSFLILLYGVVSLVVIALFVLVWAANVKGSYKNDLRIEKNEKILSFKEDVSELFNRKFYIPLLLPPFAGLILFTVLPLIFMVLIAFTSYDYNHMPPGKLFDWVGLQGFKTLFSFGDGEFPAAFLQVLLWTFVWAFFATFTNFFLGLLLAMLINKKGIRGKAFYRAAFVTAIAVPQFVTLLLMQKILDRNGILNVIFNSNVLFLTDTRYHALIPKISIILVNIWIGVPYTILMCSGLLMNVPESSVEAAKMDGANPVQIFFKITLPYILQMTTPYLITQFVGNINNFNVIWLLTNGGPVDSVRFGSTKAQATDLLVTWLYRLTTDANPQYNVASVIGIVIFVISAAISLLTFNRSGANRNEEAFQ